jgi:AraC family transcriptional regulator
VEWLARLNKAMNYIEDNLDNKIKFDTIAQMACCFTYHFQRMLSFIKAMNYIEDNLDNKLEFDTIAQMACCSTYYFQRMFSFIIDMPLAEYIWRRRMTLAAFELQNSNIKIIDLAIKYDYDSPVSFSRAFQNMHGITPSEARDKSMVLKAYPRSSFYISITGKC